MGLLHPRRWLLIATIFAVSLPWWNASASAAVIQPGQETAISAIVGDAFREAGLPDAPTISVVVDHIVISFSYANLPTTVIVHEFPDADSPRDGTVRGVEVLPQQAQVDRKLVRLAELLAQGRDRYRSAIWRPAESSKPSAVGHGRARALLLCGILWGLWRIWATRKGVNWRTTMWAGAFLVCFALAACFVATPGALHDHNSFIARADCAWTNDCARDPRGAWSLAAFDAYGFFLHVFPYRLHTLFAISLVLTLVALALAAALLAKLLRAAGHPDRGRSAGLWLLGLAPLHPVLLRVAVAETMWPYALCCCLAAALCALDAVEHEQPTGWIAAAAFFALATFSNFAFVPLLPLAILAPLCWRKGKPRLPTFWIVLGTLGVGFAIAPAATQAFFEITHRQGVLNSGVLTWLRHEVTNQLYLDPSVTPVGLIFLAAIGVWSLSRLGSRVFFPVAFAFAATEFVLANQVDRDVGYPTRYLHGYSSLIFCTFAVGAGAERCQAWWRDRGMSRSASTASLVLLTALTLPFAREGLSVLRFRPVIAVELAQVSTWLTQLPPHERLVIAPPTLAPAQIPGCRSDDPIEVFFPIGEYESVMAVRKLPPVPVMYLDEWLQKAPQAGATLVYVGTALQTFTRCEVGHNHVPATLEQPLLVELRRRCALKPVLTAKLPAQNDLRIEARIVADRRAEVEVGFYSCAIP